VGIAHLRFLKGHGTENDFVIVPDPDGTFDLSSALVAALCERRAGIGANGLLRVVRTHADPEAAVWAGDAEWFMDYRNADGSVAEMCGNGIRVFARYLVDAGLAEPGKLLIATRAGCKEVRLGSQGDVTVDMGRVALPGPDGIEVAVAGVKRPAIHVDMGNPHAVVFVDDLTEAGDLLVSPSVTPDGIYPDGVNVEFVTTVAPAHIAMRVHERGVGETRSCGTGACAAMAAAVRRDAVVLPATYQVDVPGGRLMITERADGHLEMTGPAVLVAEGELRGAWLAQVAGR
jgi:diaminopimelate epimerase